MDCAIEFIKGNWKNVLQEQFVKLKTQIGGIPLIYCKNKNGETINERLECKIHEDDQSTDSDEESGDITIVKYNKPESDAFTGLYQQIENLEKHFLNDDHKTVINEQLFQQFGHLLMRTLHKLQIYLTDSDQYTKRFDDSIKSLRNILVKREKQLQRLFKTSALSNYDYHMLQYETTLQQRAIDFNLFHSREPNFIELKVKCSDIFDLYIRQCVRFHSTLSVNGIYGDFDEFVKHFFGQQLAVNEMERKALELSFAHFDIPLDNPQIVCRKRPYARQSQSADFLPSQYINDSVNEEEIDVTFIDLIKSIRNYRWIVLLGSAGSGKRTFARWLTCQFSRALFIEEENVIIHGINMGPVRIPILIRIGEFAQWLENHSTSNLLDYIGQHTWLSQKYASAGFEMLKDFVRYGHALIILDGLDEVPTLELHYRIVTLVRHFMESHCMSHEFVSPFDDAIANAEFESDFLLEGLQGKNVVIITSRIVNYSTHPLNGELIMHCIIQPMNSEYLDSLWKTSVHMFRMK